MLEPIVLASGSSRRQDFFRLLGLPFHVMPAVIDEDLSATKDPEKLTREIAVKKVDKVIQDMRNSSPKWVCAADTVISTDSKIFGKPQNREEAAFMLNELSGRQHRAVTSIALYRGSDKKIFCKSVSCSIYFASLSDNEIQWYLDTNEWQGVAGAYRLQGLASCFITKIEGCPSTVVGLPLREFYVMLRDNGYQYGA
jgi:septum formation protein